MEHIWCHLSDTSLVDEYQLGRILKGQCPSGYRKGIIKSQRLDVEGNILKTKVMRDDVVL